MPTLRNRVRDALASADLTENEAREDFEAVLRRTPRERVVLGARARILMLALTGAAVVAYFAVGARVRAPAPAARDRGVHLYVRATLEPEEHALAIDLVATGDH